MLQIANTLIYISYFSVLIPAFFLLRKRENFKFSFIKILGILILISAFSDLLSYTVLKIGYKSNIAINNVYFILQFLLLSCIYYLLLKNKQIIYLTLIVFAIFFTINVILIQPFSEFQSYTHAVGNIILIGYSIKYYFELLKNMPATNIFRFFTFWFNTAIFYYCGASFLIFVSTNYIFKTQSFQFGMVFWSFHNINNITKNILFAAAIYFAGVNNIEMKKVKSEIEQA